MHYVVKSRIDRISTVVHSLKLARSFVTECLGLVEIESFEDEFGSTAVFDTGNGALDLLELYDPTAELPIAPHPSIMTYSVSDLAATLECIKEWGEKNKVSITIDENRDRPRVTLFSVFPTIFDFERDE